MESRLYRMNVAFETSSLPDPGTPTNSYDLLTLGYLQANYTKDRRVTGASNAPYDCVAATSIAHAMELDEDECVMYVKGDSGAVDMVANPQIAAGTKNGQQLHLIFTSDTDTVLLEDGNGLHMPQGPIRSLAGTHIKFTWDSVASLWRNSFWNNVGNIV